MGEELLRPQTIYRSIRPIEQGKLSATTDVSHYDDVGERRFRTLLSLCGILGSIALVIYFSAPFWLFPFPASSASSAQIVANATQYQLVYMVAAWLQGTGTLLLVVFVLGLVYAAKAWDRFAGWITLLAATAILMLSLTEGVFFLDITQAVSNGHREAALTSFDLTFVFIHSFFIAPSLLLPLAFVLQKSNILPRLFSQSALVIGVAFSSFGLFGLLISETTIISIALLVSMIIWMICAAIYFRKTPQTIKTP